MMKYYKTNKNLALYKALFCCILLTVFSNLITPVIGFANIKKIKQNPITVYGEIVSEIGIPIMGAVVGLQESTVQVLTDETGNFTIEVPGLKSVLSIEADGFDPITVVVSSESRLRLVLKTAIEGQGAKDRVNMPWQTTDKRSLTAAVATTTQAELRKSPTMRLNQALSGRLPGLNIIAGSAFPGDENFTLRIRGNRTLIDGGVNTMAKGGYGKPISIVDGFERDFNDIDANEIESFSVLKDAAATAIYGSRAANGVILVTTKRGQENRRTIDVEFSAGIVKATNLPDFLPAQDYAVLHNEARINDGLKPLYTDEDIRMYKDGSDPLGHPNVDYYKEFVKPLTHQIKAGLSLSGGNRIVKYFVSLAYNNQGGLYNRTNEDPSIETKLRYSRYNARTNLDIKLFKRLTASFNLSGRIEDRRYPITSGSTVFQMFSRYPSNAFPLEFTGIDPNLKKEIHMLGGNSLYTSNPLGILSYKGNYEDTQRYYQLGAQLHHDMDYLTKGLKANFEFNVDGFDQVLMYTNRTYLVWERLLNNDGSVKQYKSYNTETSLSRVWDSNDYKQWSGINLNFTYDRTFGNHKVSGLLMYKQFRTAYVQVNQPDKKVQEFVFRGDYSYKNRYFFEVTTNYSGTDNFYLTNTPRFFFPALSASWIISDEPWMKNNFMQLLKLRASWGIVGNDEYSFKDGNGLKYRFPYRERWWTTSGIHAWGIARTTCLTVREGVIPNPDFTIEKSQMMNIGLDAKFFDRRLSFTGDLFFEKRTNIYTRGAGSIPLSVGVKESNLPILNNGQVNSKGFEISVGWNHNIGDFNYWANAYIDYSTNKIINMDEPYKPDAYRVETGGSVGQDFGLVSLGLFKNKEDVESSPQQLFGPYQAGDIKYADLNHDNVIDANDYTRIGNGTFPKIGLSLDLGVAYKNFDLSLLFQGVTGRSAYLDNNAMLAFYNNGNVSNYALGRYTDQASWATATYPRLTTVANSNNWRISSYWMKDVSYLRLKNLELGYTLPTKISKKIGMNGLRVYFNAYNVFSIDNMNGMDPEDHGDGIDRYPQVQIFNFGLNFKF